MNNRHRKTLERVFARPIPGNFEWADLEALLVALGAQRANRGDSMVSFFLNEERADFHRPHPSKDAKLYQVRCVREFLELIGVKP